MTRDEYRKACIEAMNRSYFKKKEELWINGIPPLDWGPQCMTASFDALRDIAYVDPVEPTAEMLHAARNYFADGMAAYEAIAAAGDLTNWKEGKP